jgi:hypothetical protein
VSRVFWFGGPRVWFVVGVGLFHLATPALGQAHVPWHSRHDITGQHLLLEGVPIRVAPLITQTDDPRVLSLAWRDPKRRGPFHLRTNQHDAPYETVELRIDPSGQAVVLVRLSVPWGTAWRVAATEAGWRLSYQGNLPHSTRRPIVKRPSPTRPQGRITPEPVRHPALQGRWLPLPRPTRSPLPLPSDIVPTKESHAMTAVAPESRVTPPPTGIFLSGLRFGGIGVLSFLENQPAGAWNVAVPFTIAGHLDWMHMFTPFVGIGLSGGGLAYRVDELGGLIPGALLEHRRDQYHGRFVVRGRLPLAHDWEVMVEPGLSLRTVFAQSTIQTQDEPAPATSVLTRYGSSGSTGYGFHLGLGTGFGITEGLALLLQTEWQQYFTGAMTVPGVVNVFPMTRLGAYAALRVGVRPVALDIGVQWQRDTASGTNAPFEQGFWGPRVQGVWLY